MIVADASAILEWLIGGVRGQAVIRVLENEDILAPAHLDVEVAQVTRRLAHGAVITPARGRAMLELLAEAPIRRVPLPPLLPRVWALRQNLTAYDAAYVALAEAISAPLMTFDQKILSAPGHHATVMFPR